MNVELGGGEKEVSRCINCDGAGSLTCTTCQGTGIQPRYLDRRCAFIDYVFFFVLYIRVVIGRNAIDLLISLITHQSRMRMVIVNARNDRGGHI